MKGGIIIGFLALLIVGIVLVLVLGNSGIAYRMPTVAKAFATCEGDPPAYQPTEALGGGCVAVRRRRRDALQGIPRMLRSAAVLMALAGPAWTFSEPDHEVCNRHLG